MRLVLLLGCFGLLAGTPAAQATLEAAMGVRGWALIIGVSRYTHAEPLRYAASDAQAFTRFLLSPRGGGLPEERVITLVEEDANRFRILAELERLQDLVEPDDMVFVFLAGHGHVTRRGIGYFIPSDGDVSLPAPTSIPFSSLKELVEVGLAQVKHRVLVTDLCHSGRIGPEQSDLADRIQNLINEELLRIQPRTPNFLNLLASRPTEPSWERDDLSSGVFSHVLLEGLNGRAIASGNEVRARPLVDFVLQEVPKYTANQQHPMVNQEFDPDLVLADLQLPGPVPPEPPPVVELRLTNLERSGFRRIEWDDPETSARTLRSLEAAPAELAIQGLPPGRYVFELFTRDEDGPPDARIEASLSPGEVEIDVASRSVRTSAGLGIGPAPDSTRRTQRDPIPGPDHPRAFVRGFLPAMAVRGLAFAGAAFRPVLSATQGAPLLQSFRLSPATSGQPQPAARPADAALILRPQPGTRIYVAGRFAGVAGATGLVQLPGLPEGEVRLDLVVGTEREFRFRLDLSPGLQFLDWRTGQLHRRNHPVRPPDTAETSAGPNPVLNDLVSRYRNSLWTEHLVGSPESAYSLFQELAPQVASDPGTRMRYELATALGRRAQNILLRYVAGGDVRWTAEIFDEGADLIRAFRELVRTAPFLESQEAFFRGRSLLEVGEFASGIELLQTSIALDPEASHAYNALGLALWRQNRLREAIVPLETAIELSPNWTYPRNTLALVHLELRDYAATERLLRGSLDLRPKDSVAWHGLGQLHALFGRWQEAEEALVQSIDANPGNAYAHHTLGLLNQRLQRFAEAEELFRLAIRLEPDEPSFRISWAGLLRQRTLVDDADAVFRGLLASHPEDTGIRMAFAEHLAATGRRGLAVTAGNEALRLAPTEPTTAIRLGLLLMDADPEQSRALFERALAIDPGVSSAHYNLAVMSTARGASAEAESHLERALQADPSYPAAHLLLGKIRKAAGDLAQAERSLEQAVRLAVEPGLLRDAEAQLAEVRQSLLAEGLERSRGQFALGREGEAWSTLVGLWKKPLRTGEAAAMPADLRNLTLELAFRSPEVANPAQLAHGTLRTALESEFWKATVAAEQDWIHGRPDPGLDRFLEGLQSLDQPSPLLRTGFCLNNPDHSPHGLTLRWMERALSLNRPQAALQIYDLAATRQLFAPVPNLLPLTLDRLMVPDEEPHPAEFSDFDVALHPDFRLHELLAEAHARISGFAAAAQYLSALETDGPDLTLRLKLADLLQKSGLEDDALACLQGAAVEPFRPDPELAEVFLALARLQTDRGLRDAARLTLIRAREVFPRDGRINRAIRDLRRRP